MPATQTDSVARGGATIVLARITGMGFAFLLFVLLARQSEVEAGVFRSVTTFLVIAEFLGLLGTQRWLVVAIAPPGSGCAPVAIAGGCVDCCCGDTGQVCVRRTCTIGATAAARA